MGVSADLRYNIMKILVTAFSILLSLKLHNFIDEYYCGKTQQKRFHVIMCTYSAFFRICLDEYSPSKHHILSICPMVRATKSPSVFPCVDLNPSRTSELTDHWNGKE